MAMLIIGASFGTATLPDNSETRILKAEQFIQDGRLEAAEIELQAALKLAMTEGNARALSKAGKLMSEIR